MTLPAHADSFCLQGLSLRQLGPRDQAQMMAMQAEAIAALPDPAWYFPSEAWEFAAWLEGREAFGYFDGETMAGYAAIAPWHTRGAHGYAHILGEDSQNTYDFHDVLVRPAYRGRGVHTMFLSLFAEMVRALDGRAIYATVDPGNSASWRNFEKAGYVCVRVQPAYDGRMRRYYRLGLRL